MAHYGYLRVSTSEQTTENQKLEIVKAGFSVDAFFSDDGVSGTKEAMDRPAFKALLEKAVAGDFIVVTKVDRIGRNTYDVHATIKKLAVLGIGVKIIQFGGMDITCPAGKLMMAMLAACAEMERDTLVERTKAGLARTKAQGTKLGAPLTIEPSVLKELIEKKPSSTLDALSAEYGIPRSTIARNLSQWKDRFDEYSSEWDAQQSQYAAKAA
jgi:putative DNA-invertase from lambdoid prophage Rac